MTLTHWQQPCSVADKSRETRGRRAGNAKYSVMDVSVITFQGPPIPLGSCGGRYRMLMDIGVIKMITIPRNNTNKTQRTNKHERIAIYMSYCDDVICGVLRNVR